LEHYEEFLHFVLSFRQACAADMAVLAQPLEEYIKCGVLSHLSIDDNNKDSRFATHARNPWTVLLNPFADISSVSSNESVQPDENLVGRSVRLQPAYPKSFSANLEIADTSSESW